MQNTTYQALYLIISNQKPCSCIPKEFKGYVYSDGYSVYKKLSDITRCGCRAHLRRKFVETIPSKEV
nr:transposase [uncultured Blautia sp.]